MAGKSVKDLENRIKELEEELVSFRVLERTLDSTHTMFAIMDLTSRFTHVNEAHRTVLGYAPKNLLGKPGFEFIHPGDLKRLLGLLARYTKKFIGTTIRSVFTDDFLPVTETVRFRAKHKEGGWRWVEAVGSIIQRRIYCISRDVTERVELEANRKKMQDDLVRAAKLASVGTLSAGIAHQLNNPLTAVVGFAELIEDNADDPETVRARAARIRTASERMRAIVDHLCRFNRAASGKDHTVFPINDPIRNAVAITQPLLRNAGIGVEVKMADDLPRIAGDPQHLEGAFQNLIVNSTDAFETLSDRRKKRIRISAAAANHSVVVEVEDNAGGMSEEVASQAFDPFFTTKEVGSGTGLGLYVTHGVIRAHNGSVSMDSRAGEGTLLTITFPAVSAGLEPT